MEILEREINSKTSLTDRYYLFNYYYFKVMKSLLSKYAKGNLLDVGCGNKPFETDLKDKISHHIGCDISQSHLHKVDVICPADDLKFENNTFDTVLCSQVLEHLPEPNKFFEEAYRVLKPNGYLILSTNMYWQIHESPYDFYRFTYFGLKHLSVKNNFELLEIMENGGRWAMTGQILNHNIFDGIQNTKNRFTKKIYQILSKIFFVKILINLFFKFLDRKFYNSTATMNYCIVARKIS